MSTHNLDVSGARPLTITTNDPARTFASTPAKFGDDVSATLSGFSELRLELPANARLQRRRYVRKEVVYENGRPKPNPVEADRAAHPYETIDVPHERIILVLTSATMFGRTSHLPSENAPEKPPYEPTPHTSIVTKRWGDEKHFLESGDLLEERELREFLPELDAKALAKVETSE